MIFEPFNITHASAHRIFTILTGEITGIEKVVSEGDQGAKDVIRARKLCGSFARPKQCRCIRIYGRSVRGIGHDLIGRKDNGLCRGATINRQRAVGHNVHRSIEACGDGRQVNVYQFTIRSGDGQVGIRKAS